MNFNEFINFKDLVNKAEQFATEKHKGQTRKFTGKPYIIHPKNVARLVDQSGGTSKMVAAAWLHDLIEDCGVSLEEIEAIFEVGFGKGVARLVEELTSPSNLDKAKKGEYLANKMNTMSGEALIIKLCDRLDNVSDLDNAPPRFVERYVTETKFILDSLEKGGRPLNRWTNEIIAEIKKAIEPYENN